MQSAPGRTERRAGAAVGTAVFLVAAPGVVAGLLCWLITGWETGDTVAAL